jgi:signal peptidase I
MIKLISTFFSLFSWIAVPVLVLLIFYSVGSNTTFFNGYNSYLVQSGSMEPTISIGDLLITHKKSIYQKSDVVTFYSQETNRIVTHRIIDTKEGKDGQFITKGDANNEEDEYQISNSNIIGKVVFKIPKLGFLINFAQSAIGLTILILVPAAGLIFNEIVKITKKFENA